MLKNNLLILASIIMLYLLLLHFNSTNYFITSILNLAYDVIKHGHIPTKSDRILTFWEWHENQFIHYPGSYLTYAIINLIAGIDICVARFIPILFLYMFIAIYLLVSIFIESTTLRAIFTFIFAFAWLVAFPHTWMISYHALGYFSHILTVYLLTKILITKQKSIAYIIDAIVIVLIYIIALFNYYATSSFSIFFVFFLLVSYALVYRSIRSMTLITYFIIFFIFLILFILFDYTYRIFIFKSDFLGQSLSYIITSVINYITQSVGSRKLFLFGLPADRTFVEIIILQLRVLLIVLFIVLTIAIVFWRNIQWSIRAPLVVLLLASVGTGVFESIPYAYVLGGVNLRYFQLYSSIIFILIMFKLVTVRQLGVRSRVILLFFVIFSLIIITGNGVISYMDKINHNWSIKPSLSNLAEYSEIYTILGNNMRIKASFQVSGELRFVEVCLHNLNKKIINSPFLEDTYFIYSNIQNKTYFNIKEKYKRWFLVFSLLDFEKPVWGDVWGYATPPFGASFLHVIKTYFNIYYNSEMFLIVN